MNYQKLYDQLINRAKTRVLPEGTYTEKHHIKPKCLGGDNSKSNLVTLTAREHFMAHKLLVEIHPDNKKLFHAFWAMATFIKDGRTYYISSREMERLRIQYSLNHPCKSPEVRLILSEQKKGEKNPFFNKTHSEETKKKFKNRIISEETKKKISETSKGKTHSEESKKKMRKPKSEETKKRISESSKGKLKSEETKKKISESKKGQGAMGNNPSAKKIIDIETGKIFDTIKEAANYYNYKYTTLLTWLNPNQKTFNKSNLKYI